MCMHMSLHTKEPDWHQVFLFWSQLFCFAPSGSYLAAAADAAFPLIKLRSEYVTSFIHIYTHLCSKCFPCKCTSQCWEVLGSGFLGFRVSGFGVLGLFRFRVLSFRVLGKPLIIIIIIQKWQLMWLGFLVTAREEAETWENYVFVSTNCSANYILTRQFTVVITVGETPRKKILRLVHKTEFSKTHIWRMLCYQEHDPLSYYDSIHYSIHVERLLYMHYQQMYFSAI